MTGDCCLACRRPVGAGGACGLCSACYKRERYPQSWPTATFTEVDVSWQADARCAETDPELFFPEKGGSVKGALSICAQCLVRAECLDYALETRQRFGIFGGVSERGRRALLGLDDDAEEAA